MEYVSRSSWGAREPKVVVWLKPDAQRGLAVHWEGVSGPAVHAKCAAQVRGVQAYHMDGRGWVDIAYNFLVCPHGVIFEGRGWGVRSAANGTSAGNAAYHAVCHLAGPGDPLTLEAKRALNEVAKEHFFRYARATEVRPHSYFRPTRCPGPELTAWIAAGMPVPSPEEPPVPVYPVSSPPVALSHVVLPDGRQGYVILCADGGVYAFGAADYFGRLEYRP